MQNNIFFILLCVSVLAFVVSIIYTKAFAWLFGENNTRIKAGGAFLVLSIVFLFLVGATAPDAQVTPKMDQKDASLSDAKIAYETVKQWDEKDAGAGKLIVIDKKDATEKGMKLLGNQIRDEYAENKGNILVLVFTDKTAAKKRDTFAPGNAKDGGTIDLVNTYRVGLFSTVDEGADLSPPADVGSSATVLYDKSFVGLYRKGDLFGKNQWVIQLAGLWDKNKVVVNY